MQIHVTQTTTASPDGVRIELFEAGESYEMPDRLAEIFVDQGWGSSSKRAESKDAGAAPENKTADRPRRARASKAS